MFFAIGFPALRMAQGVQRANCPLNSSHFPLHPLAPTNSRNSSLFLYNTAGIITTSDHSGDRENSVKS